MLNAARQALVQLGRKRETTAEQSRYLLDMSMRFQEIVTSALTANYVNCDWFDEYQNLRFATKVVNRNDIFAKTLEQQGHSYIFEGTPSDDPEEGDTVSEQADEKKLDENILIRFVDTPDDLEELTAGPKTIDNQTSEDILTWLTKVHKDSRGFELGTFDSSLLAMTMKTQSSNWEPIAIGYIKDVIIMAHEFISDLLKLICPDQRVRDGLISALMDGLLAKYKGALDHVHFLLHVERTGTPATLNHYFNDNLQKW